MRLLKRLHASELVFRLLNLFVIFYVLVSTVYTTSFVLSPFASYATGLLPVKYSSFFSSLKFSTGRWLGSVSRLEDSENKGPRLSYTRPRAIIRWDRISTGNNQSCENCSTSMSERLFLSKAFSVSQEHLTHGNDNELEIIPYYYRASVLPEPNDITITTLVTRDRFTVFKQLVERYRGHVSVTIHVSRAELYSKNGSPVLRDLHNLYLSTPLMSRLVDVHLVLTTSPNDRQFNTWRNVARMFARSNYVMMLDVDFVPCTDFRKRLHYLQDERLKTLLEAGEAALVVPAFEYTKHEEGVDAATFPKDKEVSKFL